MNIPSVLKLIVGLFFLAVLPAQIHALTPAQIFDKVKDSIVVVTSLDFFGKVKGQGSGVILLSGKIATNCHVVEGGASYQVGGGKQLVPTALFAEDRDKDICILDAKGVQGKPAQLGNTAGLKVGDSVYAVGAPEGWELSISNGIVAQLRGGPPPLIQITAAISHGSSGGGLFDGDGLLIGLTTFGWKGGQNLNFAIPVEWIDEVKPSRKPAVEDRSKIDRQLADAWHNLGINYYKRNMYKEAIEAYRQALRINPEDARTWFNLGNVYYQLRDYDDAIESYYQALRINRDYANSWYNLGNIYFYLKQYNYAIDSYRQALRINPEDAQTWFDLGDAYRLYGNRTAALDAVRELRRLDSEKADKLFDLIVPR
jgi:hypothetical protein